VRVGRHLCLGAAVEDRDLFSAEPDRLACDVDRGVAATDDDDARAYSGRPLGLERLDEDERLPDTE
jgi:hypothetical protein